MTIEQKLQQLPEEVVKELTESSEKLELSPQILEDIRKSYCKIRAAMVFVKSQDELTRLKKQSDLIVAISKTEDFVERFREVLDAIYSLIEKEEERTVKLANIIAEVNWWIVDYEKWTEDEISEEETLEQYIERLIQEEIKSETYIPTEAKYTRWARVLWIVYKHPSRDRYYAKRVYIPSTARDIKFEWPGEFENRFGKKVYWIKLEYEVYVRPTTIHRWEVEIHLPARWVKRTKIVELPEGIQEIKLEDERPEFAYPVA